MAYIVQQANNFCPAPWNSLFVKNNTVATCFSIKQKHETTAEEYQNSEFRQNLKQSFVRNERSPSCEACWYKHDHNLASYRSKFVDRYRTENYVLEDKFKYLELRESNVCNMACRMCNPSDSSMIEREVAGNSKLAKYYMPNVHSKMTEDNWQSLLKVIDGLEGMYLTGGEPTLIKRYYELLDYLIANGRNQNIKLMLYTNCSVFSPKFVEKLLKFKKVTVICSLDGVGEVAEYIRHGAKWEDVRRNVFRYLQLPISFEVHSTINAYSILSISNLADFFNEMIESKPVASIEPFSVFTVMNPEPLRYYNLNPELRVRAVKELDLAIQKLNNPVFGKPYIEELKTVRGKLLTRRDCNFESFVKMTKDLDESRNESFEKVFGYRI
jgi:sulfatase maturation enzyme AslB (radical SAM superfamily)